MLMSPRGLGERKMATFNVDGHGHLAPIYGGPKETLNIDGLTYIMVPVGGNASPDITVNLDSLTHPKRPGSQKCIRVRLES